MFDKIKTILTNVYKIPSDRYEVDMDEKNDLFAFCQPAFNTSMVSLISFYVIVFDMMKHLKRNVCKCAII